jgi:RNA 3'-terminal phosphate cyclase (ATP)
MLTLDGAFGEGGGQIVRSALALSLLTRKAFKIENIRARRKNPGLAKQHATAVRAAARIGAARLEGACQGSKTLVFEPQELIPGHYRFPIGTAGSTTLVLQTVIVPLLLASGPSTIIIEGGTHNPMAPPFEFIDQVFLPLLRRMGARVEATLDRPGFYPRGGGRIRVEITPVERLHRIDLQTRGEIMAVRARAVIANLPRTIADRELDICRRKLSLKAGDLFIEEYKSKSPGNVVYVEVESESLTELFCAFGKKGLKAEKVADQVVKEARDYLASKVPVAHHLADQLLIPLALARGGSFRTLPLSDHTTTNIDTIKKFLDVGIHVLRDGPSTNVIFEDG